MLLSITSNISSAFPESAAAIIYILIEQYKFHKDVCQEYLTKDMVYCNNVVWHAGNNVYYALYSIAVSPGDEPRLDKVYNLLMFHLAVAFNRDWCGKLKMYFAVGLDWSKITDNAAVT